MPHVNIIGAGLAGSLLAIYLARRDLQVDVYEARGDMRQEPVAAGRSINLALSDRGITALRNVGMDEYMLAEAVPMYGRMVHSENGDTRLLRYSGREGEYINSVSRGGLNIALIDEAERYENVRFHFHRRSVGFDLQARKVVFDDGERAAAETTIAADGAGSPLRSSLLHGGVERFDLSQKWLEHGYKELHIPPGDGGTFAIEKNALHIWPRHQFMMIALPNADGSFTCTLFLAHESDTSPSFAELQDTAAVMEFFEREFPDALSLLPTLAEDFFANPTGNLGTIKCGPWHAGGEVLLLGDAAHAMVPFYGQGMNCAFEDVRVLDDLLGKGMSDWSDIYAEFFKLRKVNTDAICDMAEENFYEMRDAVADPVFVRKRELETKLEQTYADYFSKYSMVTFREDLPYATAKARGNAQDRLLMDICRDIRSISELDLDKVMSRIREIADREETYKGDVI
jgi:kynurenine 3-monooxygenase